jgi:hypothetical protein
MKRLLDCFEFCLWTVGRRRSFPLFESFEPPQGECHCEDVEDLVDLQDRYTAQSTRQNEENDHVS